MRTTTTALLGFGVMCAGACSDDNGELFQAKPACKGEAITAYAGTEPQVISKLEIGTTAEGFDLDGDGKPDNKLAGVGMLAAGAISDALDDYAIVIPIEFFDLQGAAKDSCVKFAVYLGAYVKDFDNDTKKPYIDGGDCNDHDAAIKPGALEVAGNFKDDNCDGRADELSATVPSADTQDRDGDGQSMAQGDCDDTNNLVKTGGVEICGDGLDNDCDGAADRSGGATATACSPFDSAVPQDIPLDPQSFADGAPVIVFADGTISKVGGADPRMLLHAGPSIFSVNIPVALGVSLDLRISGATIEGEVTDVGGKLLIRNGRLGGVIGSKTADTIRGLDVKDIGLKPENSLLDATFANILGPLLVLPKANSSILGKYPNCRTPDIDVDQDGLEAFCDSCAAPNDQQAAACPKDELGNPVDPKIVDVCIDGDGTEITDVVGGDGTVIMNCSEAVKGGKSRFVDGISVELNFETSPIKAIKPPRSN